MKVLSPEQAKRRTRLLRLNILLGFIAITVAFYMMITGDYANLEERKAADSIYNLIIIGSVLYMAGTWFFCAFTRPFWEPKNRSEVNQ